MTYKKTSEPQPQQVASGNDSQQPRNGGFIEVASGNVSLRESKTYEEYTRRFNEILERLELQPPSEFEIKGTQGRIKMQKFKVGLRGNSRSESSLINFTLRFPSLLASGIKKTTFSGKASKEKSTTQQMSLYINPEREEDNMFLTNLEVLIKHFQKDFPKIDTSKIIHTLGKNLVVNIKVPFVDGNCMPCIEDEDCNDKSLKMDLKGLYRGRIHVSVLKVESGENSALQSKDGCPVFDEYLQLNLQQALYTPLSKKSFKYQSVSNIDFDA